MHTAKLICKFLNIFTPIKSARKKFHFFARKILYKLLCPSVRYESWLAKHLLHLGAHVLIIALFLEDWRVWWGRRPTGYLFFLNYFFNLRNVTQNQKWINQNPITRSPTFLLMFSIHHSVTNQFLIISLSWLSCFWHYHSFFSLLFLLFFYLLFLVFFSTSYTTSYSPTQSNHSVWTPYVASLGLVCHLFHINDPIGPLVSQLPAFSHYDFFISLS